jgi:hypothetical protein
VGQLNDRHRAGLVHLFEKFLHALDKGRILIDREMRGKPDRETYFVRRFRRKWRVEQPGLAANPTGTAPGLGAMVLPEVLVDFTGNHRRIDGVGGLADAVWHLHWPHLQG